MKKSFLILSLCISATSFADQLPPSNLVSLGSLDLKDAGVSLGLDAQKIFLSGSIPKICSDRLSISSVQRFDSTRSEDELSADHVQKADDLKEFAKTIQVQITYESSETDSTLKDCILNHQSDAKADLSLNAHLSRTVSLNSEVAIAGIIGESLELKSPKYQQLENEFKRFNCKDCNSSWKNVHANLIEAQGVDSPLIQSMMQKLIETTLTETEKRIDESNSSNDLARIRGELLEMEDYLESEELKGLHLTLFEKLISKNDELSKSGFKTASMASAHADFNKDTYKALSKLKSVLPEQREEYLAKSKSMAKGSQDRVTYLSAIDPDHVEVKNYLNQSQSNLQSLQMQVHQACMGTFNPYNFTQCAELQNQYFSSQSHYSELNQRYTTGFNQNWQGIFSYWDKWNVQYNQNWKNSFLIPTQSVQPFTQNQQSQGSYFYDPNKPDHRMNAPEGAPYGVQLIPHPNPLFGG